ncbi:DUF4124 domain-containing protein [Pseudomonas sp. LS44]|uniref:DUF4124 domain-containing protein n=1 Tax=Pseudomonas sp. LS44 TaxID=1357074 RepID=UPI00215AFE03|nr:DUF4124 domain-containing protein [Pseudomonas sp. LS44]UVE19155.1 DUF4124 domain-containing protein [Pseudomonas sp. LS44]
MLKKTCASFSAALLYTALSTTIQPTLAATVFRCEDASGKVTFTSQGCIDTQAQSLQDAHNPTPGSGKPVAMAATKKSHSKSAKTKKKENVAVIAERQDGCGNQVTGSARRQAIIRKEVRAGMTRSDIESTLGKPDKVSSQNGQTRYQYNDKQGHSRQVSFDENGCVRGMRK